MVVHHAGVASSAPSRAEGWGFAEGDEIAPGRHALKLLGGGRRHEAYVAFDEALHALVVAKILRPAFVENTEALEGLAAEARIVQSLSHPVVVRCFDAVLAGDHPHLVLEFLEGPRLSTLLRKYDRLALEQLLPLGLELCSALHYLSGRVVVHLDVKPRNVIMGGPPRLIDFSVARSVNAAQQITSPVPAADVWGLGVTMYEAVVRSLPFPRTNEDVNVPAAVRFPQMHGTPLPFPDDVPAPVAAVILSCLEPRPEDRPTPEGVARALEPLVASLPRPRLVAWKPR
jgi:serine/threonine protein kinase